MKHQKVCKKVFQTKRGPFDSSKARMADLPEEFQDATEEEEAQAETGIRPMTGAVRPGTSAGGAGVKKPKEETKEQDPVKESTWKDQSESLREAMRRAKKAAFASSNQMGIDMRAMMPKQPKA